MKPMLMMILLALVAPLSLLRAVNSSGNLTIAVIGKARNNPLTHLTHSGANAAARDLGAKYNLRIAVHWLTPETEDAQIQAETIQKAILDGVDGIAVACSDSRRLTTAINDAVEAGIPVTTFNSDAVSSKRLFFCGADDVPLGEQIMDELAKLLNRKGIIGILSGNPSAPNLQRRVQGIKAAAASRYPDIAIRGVFFTKEDPGAGANRIARVMQDNPDITGWALISGSALSPGHGYSWPAGAIKCVSIIATPDQFVFVRNGYVGSVICPPYFEWSYRSVSRLIEKIIHHTDPTNVVEIVPPAVVTAANVDEYTRKLTDELKDETIGLK